MCRLQDRSTTGAWQSFRRSTSPFPYQFCALLLASGRTDGHKILREIASQVSCTDASRCWASTCRLPGPWRANLPIGRETPSGGSCLLCLIATCFEPLDRIDVHGAQRPKILSSLFYVDIQPSPWCQGPVLEIPTFLMTITYCRNRVAFKLGEAWVKWGTRPSFLPCIFRIPHSNLWRRRVCAVFVLFCWSDHGKLTPTPKPSELCHDRTYSNTTKYACLFHILPFIIKHGFQSFTTFVHCLNRIQ